MKRIIMVISLFAAFFAVSAGSAVADPGTTQATCGANDPDGLSDAKATDVFPSGGGNWSVSVTWFCGSGKTFMFELQRKANSGSNWTDVAGAAGTHHWWTSSGGCLNSCNRTFTIGGGCTASSYDYRVVVYNDNNRAYGREADYWCA